MQCYPHLPKNEDTRKSTRWGQCRGKERGWRNDMNMVKTFVVVLWWDVVGMVGEFLYFQCENIVPESHTSDVECQSQVGSQQHPTANACLFTEAYQHFCDCCTLQFKRATVTQNRAVEEETIKFIYNLHHNVCILFDIAIIISNSVHSRGLLEILPPKHHCPKQGVQEAVACHPGSNILQIAKQKGVQILGSTGSTSQICPNLNKSVEQVEAGSAKCQVRTGKQISYKAIQKSKLQFLIGPLENLRAQTAKVQQELRPFETSLGSLPATQLS